MRTCRRLAWLEKRTGPEGPAFRKRTQRTNSKGKQEKRPVRAESGVPEPREGMLGERAL